MENAHPTRTRVLSPGESHLRRERHGHQELRGVKEIEFSPVNKVEPERGIPTYRDSEFLCFAITEPIIVRKDLRSPRDFEG